MAVRQQVVVLTGQTGVVKSVAFSPDGKILATGNADTTARLWDVAYLVNDPVVQLCASAGRSLTRSEWARCAYPASTATDREGSRRMARIWHGANCFEDRFGVAVESGVV